MNSRLLRAALLLLLTLMLVGAGPAAAASLWTPVASGTSQTISSIAAPKSGELIYTTSSGEIHYLSGSTFVKATVTPSNVLGFTSVAMSPDGTHGVAVGPTGAIYNSTDSGANWTRVVATERLNFCPSPGAATGPLADTLYSVNYADATTVYATGNNDDVLKSTDGGASFTEVNKLLASCVADPGGAGTSFGDTAWLDATHGFLLSDDFGRYFVTSDGLGNGAGGTALQSNQAVNGFRSVDKLALDLSDPTHAWAISGGGGSAYFTYTTDSGTNWSAVSSDGNNVSLQDIANVGRNVVAVGLAGDIYTSIDGVKFTRQAAGAPNSTADWHSVAMVPGTATAFVGGANGALVSTNQANTLPDAVSPTGSIIGPRTLGPGQFGTYTASVSDNPGGSGVDPASYVWTVTGQPSQTGPTAKFAFTAAGTHQVTLLFKDLAGNANQVSVGVTVKAQAPSGTGAVTKSAGGATIKIFKKVTVTGRRGRYIPVNLKTKSPRRFVITLVTIKHRHRPAKTLAQLTLALQQGFVTAHLKIGSSVKSGTYQLVVQVFSTGRHGRALGRSVRQVFILQ